MDVLALRRDLESDARIRLTVLGGATPAQITEAETRLGLRFPDDYRRFLAAFGAAEVDGRAIFGLGTDLDTVGGLNVVWHTEEARRLRGLAGGSLVLSAWDDLTLEVAQVLDHQGQPIDGPVAELLVEGPGEQLAPSFSRWLERTVHEVREDHLD
jgi:hypothetical protein